MIWVLIGLLVWLILSWPIGIIVGKALRNTLDLGSERRR